MLLRIFMGTGDEMMPKRSHAGSNIALRVANAMQKMGIEGLPRNYELVYEVYSGNNPELVRDFMAIGQFKPQAALDEVGRKYLPHHHEAGVLARQASSFRDEMSNFMNLLQQERSALDDYGRVVVEAKTEMAYGANNDRTALRQSMETLRHATEDQVQRNAELAETVAAQSKTVDGLRRELADFEAAKFADPLTGLSNLRAFNKALARVYASPGMPLLCGVALGAVDENSLPGEVASSIVELATRHAGSILAQSATGTDLVARLDGSHFGFVFYTSDENEVTRLLNLLRVSVRNSRLIHPKTGRDFGSPTMSFGLCMSGLAANAEQLMAATRRALTTAKISGNRVSVYSETTSETINKDWMLYRA